MNLEKEIQFFKDANYRIPLQLETEYKRYKQWEKFVINPKDKLPYPNPVTHERQIKKRVTDIFRIRIQDPKDPEGEKSQEFLTSNQYWQGWNHKGEISYEWFAKEPEAYTHYVFATKWYEDKSDPDNPPYEKVIGMNDDETRKVYELPFNPENVLKLYNMSVKAKVSLCFVDMLGNGTQRPISIRKFSTFVMPDFTKAIEQSIRDEVELNPMAAQAMVQKGGQQQVQIDPEFQAYIRNIINENENKNKKSK